MNALLCREAKIAAAKYRRAVKGVVAGHSGTTSRIQRVGIHPSGVARPGPVVDPGTLTDGHRRSTSGVDSGGSPMAGPEADHRDDGLPVRSVDTVGGGRNRNKGAQR